MTRPADFRVPEVEDFDSPHALFAELRGHCPVAWSPDLGGFWAVTKHADICRVLTEWQTFTTTVQNVVPPVATTQRRPPLHLDPPGNIPYRNAILRFLTPKHIEAWKPVIAQMVAQYLQPYVARGGDICSDFSFILPNLLAVRVGGEALPADKILGALRQFLLVEIIAPKTFICSMAVHLARHPEHHAHLSADPSLVPVALEELPRQIVTRTRRLHLAGAVEMTRWPEYGPLGVPLRVELL